MCQNAKPNCLIDAFSCTFHGISPEKIITDILHLNEISWKHADYGRYGYQQSCQFGAVQLLYDAKQENMGVCLELTGQGCKELVQLTANNSIFYDILKNRVAVKTNLTRIDIAVDDHSGLLEMDTIATKVERGEIRTRLRSKTELRGLADTEGHTVYLGAPSSNTRIRIYDKQAQMQTVSPWVRVEMVLRHEDAHKFQNLMLDSVPVDIPHRNYEIALLGVRVLRDKLAFIEPVDANISRCPESPWWAEFLDGVQAVHLEGQLVEIPSLEQASAWMHKQAAPTLVLLYALLGNAWLEDLLLDGCQRMDMARAETWLQEMSAYGLTPALDPRWDTFPTDLIAGLHTGA